MSRKLGIVIYSIGLVLTCFAQSASGDDRVDCAQAASPDRIIAACTASLSDPSTSESDSAFAFARRGFGYFLKHDYDRAWADCEAALRLNQSEGGAYLHRGLIQQIRGDLDSAIADFGRALALGWADPPGFPSPQVNRGIAYANKGDTRRAMQDFDATLRDDPNDIFARLGRGILNTYSGSPDRGAKDFRHIADLHPKDSIFALWLHIAEHRAGRESDLAVRSRQFNMTRWPAPAIRLMIGDGTLPLQLSDAEMASGLQCEADFYSAEYLLWQRNKADAVRLYRSAQQRCLRIWVEWQAATAALRSVE